MTRRSLSLERGLLWDRCYITYGLTFCMDFRVSYRYHHFNGHTHKRKLTPIMFKPSACPFWIAAVRSFCLGSLIGIHGAKTTLFLVIVAMHHPPFDTRGKRFNPILRAVSNEGSALDEFNDPLMEHWSHPTGAWGSRYPVIQIR